MSNLGRRPKTKPGPTPGDVSLLSSHHLSLLEVREGCLPIPLCPQLCQALSPHRGAQLPSPGPSTAEKGQHPAPIQASSAWGSCQQGFSSCQLTELQFIPSLTERSRETPGTPSKGTTPQQRLWALQVRLQHCQKSQASPAEPCMCVLGRGCGPPTGFPPESSGSHTSEIHFCKVILKSDWQHLWGTPQSRKALYKQQLRISALEMTHIFFKKSIALAFKFSIRQININ